MTMAVRRTAEATGHAEMSGILLMSDNSEAFAARLLAARAATRSLDLLYYLWQDDTTGLLLLEEVRAAADRGVKVRILLDDINPRHRTGAFAELNDHSNVEMKLFNPTWIRSGPLRALELILRRFSLTRRMHNKAWIVDDAVAIVGGRNIGDAYFNAADTNFRDLDLLLMGRAVKETRDVFDAFWNFRSAKPMRKIGAPLLLVPARRDPKAESPKVADVLRRYPSLDALLGAGDIHWSAQARVISDPPQKAKGRRRRNWLTSELLPMIRTARKSLRIVSPYFIPGRQGLGILQGLIDAGAEVTVLTNSLAATDVAVVHGGYANYRRRLLSMGVRLFELQPEAGRSRMSVLGSKGASLHTKAFTVDGRSGFVGSMNFDPRSLSLNTEMGVIFEDADLVGRLDAIFVEETDLESSFHVTLDGGHLYWEGLKGGKPYRSVSEPDAGWARRVVSSFVRVLPVESEL